MTYSQKYCLVSFVHPVAIGTKFDMTEWPLHLTLADVFAIDRIDMDIDTQLAALAAKRPPFPVVADKEVTLGTTRVVLLRKSTALLELHGSIVDLLEVNGATFNTPEFTRKGFLPHCTIQKRERIQSNDEINIETIALIDMFLGGNWRQRKVLNLFALKAK